MRVLGGLLKRSEGVVGRYAEIRVPGKPCCMKVPELCDSETLSHLAALDVKVMMMDQCACLMADRLVALEAQWAQLMQMLKSANDAPS